APYFHNGGTLTLDQIVEFYDRGGDFADQNIKNLDNNIRVLGFTDEEDEALVAFLAALTDERVRFERAPFDHPSLSVPNGGSGNITFLFGFPVMDDRISIPAVGAAGVPSSCFEIDTGHRTPSDAPKFAQAHYHA